MLVSKNSIIYTAFVLVIFFGVLHFIAETFYFYWTIWWFDKMMHFLGGFTGGIIAFWLLIDSGLFFKNFPKKDTLIFSTLFLVLFFGIAWELFEYTNGIARAVGGYAQDTFFDLLLDATGAVLACLVVWKNRFVVLS